MMTSMRQLRIITKSITDDTSVKDGETQCEYRHEQSVVKSMYRDLRPVHFVFCNFFFSFSLFGQSIK